MKTRLLRADITDHPRRGHGIHRDMAARVARKSRAYIRGFHDGMHGRIDAFELPHHQPNHRANRKEGAA